MHDVQIEPFDQAKHQRSGFSCGQPSLDGFLKTLVTQYEKRRMGKTFVAVRPGDSRVQWPHTKRGAYYTPALDAYWEANIDAARWTLCLERSMVNRMVHTNASGVR